VRHIVLLAGYHWPSEFENWSHTSDFFFTHSYLFGGETETGIAVQTSSERADRKSAPNLGSGKSPVLVLPKNDIKKKQFRTYACPRRILKGTSFWEVEATSEQQFRPPSKVYLAHVKRTIGNSCHNLSITFTYPSSKTCALFLSSSSPFASRQIQQNQKIDCWRPWVSTTQQ